MTPGIHKTCLGCLAGAALAVLAALPAQACEAHAQTRAPGAVTAADAWVPAAPPGVRTHAAYLVLRNGGGKYRAVTAVHSPQYASASFHVSRTRNGIAMMQHLAQVDLPPGASVAFKPQGLHIMLMGPKGPLVPGGVVNIDLTLDDGSTVRATAEVRKRSADGSGDHIHHDHKGS